MPGKVTHIQEPVIPDAVPSLSVLGEENTEKLHRLNLRVNGRKEGRFIRLPFHDGFQGVVDFGAGDSVYRLAALLLLDVSQVGLVKALVNGVGFADGVDFFALLIEFLQAGV